MSEASHTPGPWQARFIYRMIQQARKFPKGLLVAAPPENDWADARLMAASPDMLAELERVQWVYYVGSNPDRKFAYCPCCEGVSADDGGKGHLPSCTLAAAIAKATTA